MKTPKRRSLAELDEVIEESLARNPDFIAKVKAIIDAQLKETKK